MHPGPTPKCLAKNAPVAQLDRAPDYESGGQEFESLRARHFGTKLGTPKPADFALEAATSVRRSSLFEPIMRTSFSSTSTRWASARRWSRRYPPDSGRLRLRAWLAKVFSACAVMLGPSRSSAPSALSASARA